MSSHLKSIGFAALILSAIFILLPNFTTSPASRIQSEDIRVHTAGPNGHVRRLSVNDPVIYLADQFKHPQNSPRQFSYGFTPDSNDTELAIFSPAIGGPVRISINGAPFARGEPHGLSAYGFGGTYLFAPIDTKYFHPGLNRIDIILAEDLNRVGLRRLHIGKTSEVEALSNQYLMWIRYLRFAGLFVGMTGLICAIMGLLLGGHRCIMMGGFGLSALLIFQNAEFSVAANISAPFVWSLLIILSCGLTIIGLYQRPIKNPSFFKGLAFSSLIAALYGLHVLLPFGYTAFPIKAASFTLLGLFPMILIGLPLILSSDIISFREQARLAREDARLKSEIITRQDAELRREIEQKAVLQERQRFTRDMHDGIGGQLLSLLMRVRTGRVGMDGIETEIQSGINDLRLVVDSLDHVGDDLSDALITFQSRARAQLDAANISLDWTQSETIDSKRFKTRRILNLYRFLQEAITNIVRHSGAVTVRVEIFSLQELDKLRVIIEDDGKGLLVSAQNKAGKGLKNMRSRAEKLKGDLSFETPTSGAGTRIELNMPLGENETE